MFATGETVGLAEWIIDDTCLVSIQFLPWFLIFFLFSVPSAPSDIKAVTSGDHSVIVSWRPPNSPNGNIQKYTVYRREVVNGEEVYEKDQ